MSITVTGATGPFGRLAIDALLRRGIPASEIVAVGRDVTKIADLSRRGVTVRRADYEDPTSLRAAFADTDTLLFVSGSEVGRRIAQHQAVITAAAEAEVSLVAYTSAPKADTSDMMLVEDHRATEHALIASGLPYVFLRNGWYLENYTAMLPMILAHGLFGAAGDGLISGAARADLAEAAAAVIVGQDRDKAVYELGGPPFTLAQLAMEISRASSREISYTDLSEEAYARMLMAAGVPQPMAVALADTHRAAAQGALYIEGDDLPRLLGRPVTSLAQVIRAALNLTFCAVVRLTCANAHRHELQLAYQQNRSGRLARADDGSDRHDIAATYSNDPARPRTSSTARARVAAPACPGPSAASRRSPARHEWLSSVCTGPPACGPTTSPQHSSDRNRHCGGFAPGAVI